MLKDGGSTVLLVVGYVLTCFTSFSMLHVVLPVNLLLFYLICEETKKNPVPVKQKAGGGGGLHRYVKIFKKKTKLHFEHTRPYGNRTVTSKTFVL